MKFIIAGDTVTTLSNYALIQSTELNKLVGFNQDPDSSV